MTGCKRWLSRMTWLSRMFVLLAAASAAASAAVQAAEPRCYLIGNSLTWDTRPSLLDGDVQWHVDCGKSLPYIYEHPEEPCVESSSLWPQSLRGKKYDIVCVQSHYGATLEQEVATIAKWVDLQPQAVFVIHTGWARSASRADEYAAASIGGDRKMQHSPVYIRLLLAELQKRRPDTTFRQTGAMDLLAVVADDVRKGTAPLKDVAELYRDKIHMKLDTGRYLMHNAMRSALGQPRSAKGFEKLEPAMKRYLDSVLQRAR